MFVKSRKRSCFRNIMLAGTYAIYFAINISEGRIDITSLTDIFFKIIPVPYINCKITFLF